MVYLEEKWVEEITTEMLPEPYDYYAGLIGMDNFYKLSKELGGTALYIPKTESLFRELRNKKIKEEFNGGNYKDLALKYGLSERFVREICAHANIVLPGQVTLFDINK